MGQGRRFLMLLALGHGFAGCAGGPDIISPNDVQYARSGAPRAGEPATPQQGGYVPLGSNGGGGGGGGGGM